jgi:hypothetical protein
MNTIRILASTVLLASLAACNNTAPPPSTSSTPTASTKQPTSALGRIVDKEIREAREKLATENISVNGGVRVNAGNHGGLSIHSDDGEKDTRPKAEITPQGDLLIEGKAVAINAQQRALLLEYRTHVIGIAESGMDIGVQGADLAAKAMGEAFKGIFSGKSEQEIEKTVEAEATGIKAAAAKLCDRLPAMMASQQKLAAALPEFKPYATMRKEDIDDCMKDSQDDNTAKRAEVQSEVRSEIRSAIRESVRATVRQDDAKDATVDAQAEASAETAAKQ